MDLPLPLIPENGDPDFAEKMVLRQLWLDVYDQSKWEILKNLSKKLIMNELSKGTYNGVLQQVYNRLPRVDNTSYKMVTISSKDNIDPVLFWKRCTEYINNSEWIKKAIYCLEQRSQDDQEPYGWHIHVLGTFCVPKSIIIQKTYKSFKRFVVAPNYIDVRSSTDDRINYIKGQKSQGKMPKVLKDRILRHSLNIPDWLEKKSNDIVSQEIDGSVSQESS